MKTINTSVNIALITGKLRDLVTAELMAGRTQGEIISAMQYMIDVLTFDQQKPCNDCKHRDANCICNACWQYQFFTPNKHPFGYGHDETT